MDSTLYRQVMRRYATGVMILTVPDGGGFHAVTVNSVTSVSLDPTLLLVCLERDTRSHDLVRESGTFALNVLGEPQRELGITFAFERGARTAPLAYAAGHLSANGELLLDGCLAYLECRVTAGYPGGDHTIFLGEVLEGSVEADGEPLVYFQGKWLGVKE